MIQIIPRGERKSNLTLGDEERETEHSVREGERKRERTENSERERERGGEKRGGEKVREKKIIFESLLTRKHSQMSLKANFSSWEQDW